MNINKQGIVTSKELIETQVINPNLIKNSFTMPLGTANASTGTWRLAGTNNMTRSRVQLSNGEYCFQNSGIQTAYDASCYGIDNFPTTANTDYVISFDARLVEGTQAYAGFSIHSATVIDGNAITVKTYYTTPITSSDWKRCWLHFKTNTATQRNIYIGIKTDDTTVTTQIRKVKIEQGTFPTPWIPNEADTEYSNFPIVRIANDYLSANDFNEI